MNFINWKLRNIEVARLGPSVLIRQCRSKAIWTKSYTLLYTASVDWRNGNGKAWGWCAQNRSSCFTSHWKTEHSAINWFIWYDKCYAIDEHHHRSEEEVSLILHRLGITTSYDTINRIYWSILEGIKNGMEQKMYILTTHYLNVISADHIYTTKTHCILVKVNARNSHQLIDTDTTNYVQNSRKWACENQYFIRRLHEERKMTDATQFIDESLPVRMMLA